MRIIEPLLNVCGPFEDAAAIEVASVLNDHVDDRTNVLHSGNLHSEGEVPDAFTPCCVSLSILRRW